MSKPKIVSITYSEELPKESTTFLYRLLEKLVINALPADPTMVGLFLQKPLDEKNKNREEIPNAKEYSKRYYEEKSGRISKN